jgi:hypothetical protein
VCVSKIQRQEEKSKLLKGGISFEETKPPWKNARLLQPQKPCQTPQETATSG